LPTPLYCCKIYNTSADGGDGFCEKDHYKKRFTRTEDLPMTTPRQLILCALFAALTAILSQFAIPMEPVPVNLATFSVLCAGALLGARLGAVSQLIYVLLGVAGIPVFANLRGGVGVALGPTGGYLAGYVAAAWLAGFITERGHEKPRRLGLAMTAGMGLCYLLGTAWFMYSTQSGLGRSLALCVLPFLPGDALKIIGAAALAHRLRLVLRTQTASLK
jgi:biotin transport system substrate-specific component